MLVLVGGGALLDYRNSRSLTPTHVAVLSGNRDALMVSRRFKEHVTFGQPPVTVTVTVPSLSRVVFMLACHHTIIGQREFYNGNVPMYNIADHKATPCMGKAFSTPLQYRRRTTTGALQYIVQCPVTIDFPDTYRWNMSTNCVNLYRGLL